MAGRTTPTQPVPRHWLSRCQLFGLHPLQRRSTCACRILLKWLYCNGSGVVGAGGFSYGEVVPVDLRTVTDHRGSLFPTAPLCRRGFGAIMSVSVPEIERSAESAATFASVRAIPDGAVVRVDGVAGWILVDRERTVPAGGAVWAALLPCDESLAFTVLALTPGEVTVMSTASPSPWWSRTVPVLRGALESRLVETQAVTDLQEARAALREEHARHARQVDKLVEDAHSWADENDLCSRFDDFMVEHDLPPRDRDFDVEVKVTLTSCVRVRISRVRDAQAAENAVDDAEVREALAENGIHVGNGLDLDDFSIEDAEAV